MPSQDREEDPHRFLSMERGSQRAIITMADQSSDFHHVLTTEKGRKLSYTLVEPSSGTDKSTSNVAVLYFGPLSGSSLTLKYLQPAIHKQNYRCSFLSVDRPDCGETDPPVEKDVQADSSKEGARRSFCGSGKDVVIGEPDDKRGSIRQDPALRRIDTHVEDVLDVMRRHGITEVYILAVCLGHPFGVALCNRIRNMEQRDSSPSPAPVRVRGLTLVAPFVSTACPQAWKVARFGARVPSFLLYCSTEMMASAAPVFQSMFLTPDALGRLISEQEREDFGFTDKDLEDICQVAIELGDHAKNARAVEARFGSDPVWQRVCDDFVLSSVSETTDESTSFPIHIHASPHDKVAPIDSVRWVSERCYASCPITIHDNISSHELMTFLGGPFSNPTLLFAAMHEWGLLSNPTDA